ncbi:MAG: hypothetical protein AAGN66_09070 [Acidobacteriota bacterium]
MSSENVPGSEDPVEGALRALGEAARREQARLPGHLVRRPGDALEVTLTVPLEGEVAAAAVEEARGALRAELEALIAHRAAFKPGRVLNLRTGSAEGEATVPPDARSVFAGYGPTGVPKYRNFGQWLMDLEHPDFDRVYGRPPALVTAMTRGEDLESELLPAFRGTAADYRIHGQVVAGWFEVPRRDGSKALLALTVQLVSSSRGTKGHRRFGLNVLGVGPDGEPLEAVLDRLGTEAPWQPAVDWGQQALATVEGGQGRRGNGRGGNGRAGKGRGGDGQVAGKLGGRLDGILGGVARRLEQGRRARDRRTRHAEERHRQGERPTRMALQDLSQASAEDVLHDERQGTFVVLGDRGRAHVWNPSGKLVTSIRYSPDSVARKKRQQIWRRATAEEAAELRRRVGD